jgi:hypothetical protein
MKNLLYNLQDLWVEIQIRGEARSSFMDRAESLLREADAFPDLEAEKDQSYRAGYNEGFDDGVASVGT